MFAWNEVLPWKSDSLSSHSVSFLEGSRSSSKEASKLLIFSQLVKQRCMLCTGSNLIFSHGQHGLMLWKPYGCHLRSLNNSLSVSGHGDSIWLSLDCVWRSGSSQPLLIRASRQLKWLFAASISSKLHPPSLQLMWELLCLPLPCPTTGHRHRQVCWSQGMQWPRTGAVSLQSVGAEWKSRWLGSPIYKLFDFRHWSISPFPAI